MAEKRVFTCDACASGYAAAHGTVGVMNFHGRSPCYWCPGEAVVYFDIPADKPPKPLDLHKHVVDETDPVLEFPNGSKVHLPKYTDTESQLRGGENVFLKPSKGALNMDSGKNPISQGISPESEWELGLVAQYGMNKGYAAMNWRGPMLYSRVIDSMRRHLNKFRRGELMDEESGLESLAHHTFRAQQLLTYRKLGYCNEWNDIVPGKFLLAPGREEDLKKKQEAA